MSMDRVPKLALAVALSVAALAVSARAERLPSDAGAINVRDFGAQGNGHSDDTAALLKAIAASGEDTGRRFWQDRTVYLPDGVYLISAPLLKRYANGNFASGLMLQGQSQAHTVIRLVDRAPGFGDATQPRAVIFTTSKQLDGTPTSGGKDYPRLGEGNDAYMNFVEDLTVEIGSGNPGAIGIDYLANNIGAIRDVTVRAPADSGVIGLSMTRKWPGPALIQRLTIQGFATGIATAQTEYGLTFDHIRLIDQRSVGLRNDQNALAIRDIEIRGPARPIVNAGDRGFLAIDGAALNRTSGRGDVVGAIDNAGMATLRDVRLAGGEAPLSGVLEGRGQWKPTAPPAWLPRAADNPPTPQIPPEQWSSAARFGAAGDGAQDATGGLRRALASGAAVVYLPHGTYAISDAIDVPATVRRIVGMNSTLKILAKRQPSFSRSGGMLKIASSGQPLSIERLAFDNTDMGAQLALEVSGARDVVIQDVVSAGVTLLDRKQEGGRVFIEDVCCGRMQIAGSRPVVARQLDTEGGGVRILNVGSPLQILGLKTEGISTIVENRQGAHTDIFGGLVYMVHDNPATAIPALHNIESWLAASFAEESLRANSRYSVFLAQESPAGRKTLDVNGFPERGFGRFVPSMAAAPDGATRAGGQTQ
jgi:Pectate lyase superfamily protein